MKVHARCYNAYMCTLKALYVMKLKCYWNLWTVLYFHLLNPELSVWYSSIYSTWVKLFKANIITWFFRVHLNGWLWMLNIMLTWIHILTTKHSTVLIIQTHTQTFIQQFIGVAQLLLTGQKSSLYILYQYLVWLLFVGEVVRGWSLSPCKSNTWNKLLLKMVVNLGLVLKAVSYMPAIAI